MIVIYYEIFAIEAHKQVRILHTNSLKLYRVHLHSLLFLQLLALLWLVEHSTGRTIHNRIVLCNNDWALCNGSKFSSCKFIYKMAEIIVIFLFGLNLLDGKLELALDFPKEHVVNKNIIVFLIKFVLNPH